LQKLGDVAKAKIAVLAGSSTIATVRYLLPTAQLVGVDSSTGAIATGNWCSIRICGRCQRPQRLGTRISQYLLTTLLGADPLCVVMPKGLQYDHLRRQLNAAIARYSATGWLQQRAAYWGLPSTKLGYRGS